MYISTKHIHDALHTTLEGKTADSKLYKIMVQKNQVI